MTAAAAGAQRRPQRAGYSVASDADRDPLDRQVNDDQVFEATVRHYASLAGVDTAHLITALRLGGVPGVPVTAKLIRDTANGLRDAGYVVPPPPAPVATPEELAELEQHRARGRARAAAGRARAAAARKRAGGRFVGLASARVGGGGAGLASARVGGAGDNMLFTSARVDLGVAP